MRSKGVLFILAVALMAGLGWCYGCTSYNGLVSSEETVAQAWADVENQYQRRVDLVPPLLEVVKSAASIDRSLIDAVKESEEAVEHTRVMDASDEVSIRRYADRQLELSSNLQRLRIAVQSDEGLQSVEAHRDLLVQIEGTENRIAVARRKYNDVVAEYNQNVRKFPKSLFAGLFGFETRSGFTAETK